LTLERQKKKEETGTRANSTPEWMKKIKPKEQKEAEKPVEDSTPEWLKKIRNKEKAPIADIEATAKRGSILKLEPLVEVKIEKKEIPLTPEQKQKLKEEGKIVEDIKPSVKSVFKTHNKPQPGEKQEPSWVRERREKQEKALELERELKEKQSKEGLDEEESITLKRIMDQQKDEERKRKEREKIEKEKKEKEMQTQKSMKIFQNIKTGTGIYSPTTPTIKKDIFEEKKEEPVKIEEKPIVEKPAEERIKITEKFSLLDLVEKEKNDAKKEG